jgi:hypothetical protein
VTGDNSKSEKSMYALMFLNVFAFMLTFYDTQLRHPENMCIYGIMVEAEHVDLYVPGTGRYIRRDDYYDCPTDGSTIFARLSAPHSD